MERLGQDVAYGLDFDESACVHHPQTVDELGLAERTIFVFTGDNGGVDWHDAKMKQQAGMDAPPTSNLPLRSGKASLY